MDIELTLRTSPDTRAKTAVKRAITERKKAKETLEQAWERIFTMKNSEVDEPRLREVQQAMIAGVLGRCSDDLTKRFSKAEALRMWGQLQTHKKAELIRDKVANTPAHYILVTDERTLAQAYEEMDKADMIALDCETFGENGGALDPWIGEMAGFSVSTRAKSFYIPLNHREKTALTSERIFTVLRPLLETKPNVMHNAPFDCKWFSVKYGMNVMDVLHADTRIMAMSLDENRSHRLKELCTDWLGVAGDNFDTLFGKTPFCEVKLDVALSYAAGDTEKTLALYDWMMKQYEKREDLRLIQRLVFDIEMPVCRTFIKADLRGIRFDCEKAEQLDKQLKKEEEELRQNIYQLLGDNLNLNSPVQLSRKLYTDLGLPDHDEGSTGVQTLKRIKKAHPVIPLILAYRGIGKLRQAFTSKLPNSVKSDGNIHPCHNTWGAATGRFTCNSPNTQQIPAKRPEIRNLFIPTSPDRIFVSIDYSQIELRVLAHMANEPVLLEAFAVERDIHSTTAALISKGKYTYEDIEQHKDTEGHACQKLRKQAKVVNFGIVYGMGASRLADTLEITKYAAQSIINNYFKGYPQIKRYMDGQQRKVKQEGFVTDLAGRKRRLRVDVKNKDRWKLYAAQRMGGNFPIQSGAGTILKKAIVNLEPVLKSCDAYILLQVHDELVFDCPRNITQAALTHIRNTMEQAVPLRCPVRCDVEINPSCWMRKVDTEAWFEEQDL